MSGSDRIESAQNESFRRLMRLVESSHERRRTQRSVIEGEHLLQAFLDAVNRAHFQGGAQTVPVLHDVFVLAGAALPPATETLLERLMAATAQAGADVPIRRHVLSEPLFRKASQVRNGQGPLAVISTPRPALPASAAPDTLYLDGVQDPGNVGAILRTAAAAGVRCVLSGPGTAFNWAPKVLRSAMGAHFALALHEGVPHAALTPGFLGGLMVRALAAPEQAGDARDLHESDITAPGIWLVGSEGQGLADALLALPGISALSIEQARGVESMNVAAAVAVALFEQRRQRRVIGL